ncbi:MAG: hypothetical protein QXK88_11880 [Desulfurococcaceae archaeon]
MLCREIVEPLKPLSRYVEEVKSLIRSNPRHKTLRPYLDVIIETLEKLPASDTALELIRESLDELEKMELRRIGVVYRTPIPSYHHRVVLGGKDYSSGDEPQGRWEPSRPVNPLAERESQQPISSSVRRGLEDSGSRRLIGRKVLAMALVVLVVLGVGVLEPQYQVVRKIIEESKKIVTFFIGPSFEDIRLVALNKLNRMRIEHGLPPLRLLNLSIAQFRADDMVVNKYFGHCDLRDRIPNYWYTALGGLHVLEENIELMKKCETHSTSTIPADISMREASTTLRDLSMTWYTTMPKVIGSIGIPSSIRRITT